MPATGNPPHACRFFRLRYGASLLLSAGVCFCVVNALNPPSPTGNPSPAAPSPQVTGSAAPVPLPKPEIVIDPGHGGLDPGTSAHGQQEKSWTLNVGTALAKELESRGWPVVLTRDADSFLSPMDRSVLANQKPRLAFVSLHFNAGGPDAVGIESYYAWPRRPETMARLMATLETPDGQTLIDDRSRLLAESLQSALCNATGAKDRGVRNDPSHAVTGHTVCPAVLVELGFLTNAAESRGIQSEAYRKKIVQGLADGMEQWLREAATPGFGVRFEAQNPPVPVTAQALGDHAE
jgi:N-acetylmuramoyl-L-alanine amidase